MKFSALSGSQLDEQSYAPILGMMGVQRVSAIRCSTGNSQELITDS